MSSDKPTKKQSVPPKTQEQLEAEAALEAACAGQAEAACQLDAAATSLKKTVSSSKMQAVRLPTPSQTDLETPAPKR